MKKIIFLMLMFAVLTISTGFAESVKKGDFETKFDKTLFQAMLSSDFKINENLDQYRKNGARSGQSYSNEKEIYSSTNENGEYIKKTVSILIKTNHCDC